MTARDVRDERDPAATLVRAWADGLAGTAYLPWDGHEVSDMLAGFVERLRAALGPPTDRAAAEEVGAALVEHHITGGDSLSCTLDVLLPGLRRLEPQRREAVPVLLGALAAGVTAAENARVLAEQESVHRALLGVAREAERELRGSEARFREVLTSSAVGIAITELDGTVVDANDALGELLGRPGADLTGTQLLDLLRAGEDDDGTVAADGQLGRLLEDATPDSGGDLAEAYRRLADQDQQRFRRRHRTVDGAGEPMWTYLAAAVLHDGDGRPTQHVTFVEDVTELHLLQQRLSEQALHDLLTGLPNVQYFTSHLEEVVGRSAADPLAGTVGLLAVDVDGLLLVNDGLGRDVGDELLRTVAGRLVRLVGDGPSMIARAGDGSFLVLLEGAPSAGRVAGLAATITEELAEPVFLAGQHLSVSAGVGAVHDAPADTSAAELLRRAEAALHRAKRAGRGQWALYDEPADLAHRRYARLATALPGAWEEGDVVVRYEPVRSAADDEWTAMQAVLHWDGPDGVLDSERCLALAQETGVSVAVGRWLLRTACADAAQWKKELDGSTPLLRVDLTPELLADPDLVAVLRSALDDADVALEQVQLGVPLGPLDADRGDAVDNLQVLVDVGARLVLLGAGADTGFLAHLEEHPVAAVEIAPRVVRRLVDTPGRHSVVARAVTANVELVRTTGAQVLVPGVVTAEQAQWWRDAGADGLRGPGVGQHVSGDEVPDVVRPPFEPSGQAPSGTAGDESDPEG